MLTIRERCLCKIWVGGFVGRLERYFRLGRIVIDLGVVGGQPCIGGLRILFSLIVRLVAFGKGVKDILDDFSEFGGRCEAGLGVCCLGCF